MNAKSKWSLALVVLLTVGAISDAAAQESPGACLAEVPCNDRGTVVRAHLVPETILAKCEGYKAGLERERQLHTKTLSDAKIFRQERDRCVGELTAEKERLAQLQFDRDSLHVQLSDLRAREATRWTRTTWFIIGVSVGAAVVGGGVIWVLK